MIHYNVVESPNLDVSSHVIGTIQVHWIERKSLYTCTICDRGNMDMPIVDPVEIDKAEIANFKSIFQTSLARFIEKEYPAHELKAIFDQLKGQGHRLFQRLIPTEFHTMIRNWPTDSIVNISTNECFIPWELLYDGNNFLGLRFALCRLPRHITRINREQKNDAHSIVHIKHEKLQKSISSSQIFKNHPLPVDEPKPNIEDVRKAVECAAIIDFLCHCQNEGVISSLCLGSNFDQEIQATQIETFHLQDAVLVFANACESSNATLLLNELVDFASEFYKAGAQAYIGTIGKIPVKFAPLFSQAFYTFLAQDLPAYWALYKTKKKYYTLFRKKLREEGLLQHAENDKELDEDSIANRDEYIPNLLWLLYSYYGNPIYWKPIQGGQHGTNH